MNLKEHIQSEIKSQLGESVINEVCWDNYKQVGMKTKGGKQVPNCVPEGLKEGIMSDIHLTIKSSSTEEDFIKKFFKKYGKQVKPNKESIEWVKGLYSDVKNESVNEEQIDEKEGVPHYTKDGTEWKGEVHKMPDDSLMSGNPHDVNGSGPDGKSEKLYHKEDLDEKLITFSNRAPYGQIVFMAGGAGSGKGFAIDNFIDSAGFKVRDVDEMKKAVGKLDKLGKFSVDKWYKKYGKNLSSKSKDGGLSPKAHVEEFVLGTGMSISDVASDLKNPNNVASLHYIVDAMGLKDKWVINMLSGKTNKETLPNLLFDITAKKVSSITDVIKPLIEAGYNSKNVHLIWVLKNYHAAVKANKTRDRVVPDDILLQTHEGASQTMWQVLTKIKPKGLDGRIDVILNNNKFTAKFVDSNGKEIQVEPNQMNKLKKAQPVVSGFKSLPIKKQGGAVIEEKYWQNILKGWILSNTPDTIDFEELENPTKDTE
tara:strand:- start:438 stop:1883 length:1446 start_codon:yes stop_codon:yes gene_type:complete